MVGGGVGWVLEWRLFGFEGFVCLYFIRTKLRGEERSDKWKVFSCVERRYIAYAVASLKPSNLTRWITPGSDKIIES